MSVMCDVIGCIYNDGSGMCDKLDIYISDAETGDPFCQDIKTEED